MDCRICGAKNISPSMGGADICPTCDCYPKEESILRQENSKLRIKEAEWIADRDRWIARREDEYKRAEGLLKERDELLQKMQRLEDAIRNEAEFPGEMPEGMAQTIQDIGLAESLRLIVRMTKNNILKQGGLKP